MTPDRDWDGLAERWLSEGMSHEALASLVERTRSARAAIRAMRLLAALAAIVALAVVAAALRHAANRFELALGAAVAVGITVTWLMDASNRRQALENVDASPAEYIALRRALGARRIRFARLAWIVVGLDFVFLVPWWIGGLRVHGHGFNVAQVATIWAPVALMIAFVFWTVRMRRRAMAELRNLEGTAAS